MKQTRYEIGRLKYLLFIFFMIPVTIYSGNKNIYQKSAALNEFYNHEQQSWYEKITWQNSTQTGLNIDILFYHIKADI